MAAPKSEERHRARQLRAQGYSVKRIAAIVGVSKGSVSVWVRDVPLTDVQRERLREGHIATLRGRTWTSRAHAERRAEAAARGLELARSSEAFRQLCMLYWGEGFKSRASGLGIVNSDPELLKYFLHLCYESLDFNASDVRMRLAKHAGAISRSDAEAFWLTHLELPQTALRTGLERTGEAGRRGETLPLGTCSLLIGTYYTLITALAGIQAIAGFQRAAWSRPCEHGVVAVHASYLPLQRADHAGTNG